MYSLTGEKVVRDKAVATLSRFLAGTKKVLEEDEALEIGDLNWEKEFKVDTRLAPLEMAKLWKGIFFCKSSQDLFSFSSVQQQGKLGGLPSRAAA